MPVAGSRSVDRLKGLIHLRYLLLKRVAGSGRQWKRILCCSRWLKVAPLVVDRLKASIQTTVSRVGWKAVVFKRLIVSMERYLNRIREILQRLAVSATGLKRV
jgi:hypothetical protein